MPVCCSCVDLRQCAKLVSLWPKSDRGCAHPRRVAASLTDFLDFGAHSFCKPAVVLTIFRDTPRAFRASQCCANAFCSTPLPCSRRFLSRCREARQPPPVPISVVRNAQNTCRHPCQTSPIRELRMQVLPSGTREQEVDQFAATSVGKALQFPKAASTSRVADSVADVCKLHEWGRTVSGFPVAKTVGQQTAEEEATCEKFIQRAGRRPGGRRLIRGLFPYGIAVSRMYQTTVSQTIPYHTRRRKIRYCLAASRKWRLTDSVYPCSSTFCRVEIKHVSTKAVPNRQLQRRGTHSRTSEEQHLCLGLCCGLQRQRRLEASPASHMHFDSGLTPADPVAKWLRAGLHQSASGCPGRVKEPTTMGGSGTNASLSPPVAQIKEALGPTRTGWGLPARIPVPSVLTRMRWRSCALRWPNHRPALAVRTPASGRRQADF